MIATCPSIKSCCHSRTPDQIGRLKGQSQQRLEHGCQLPVSVRDGIAALGKTHTRSASVSALSGQSRHRNSTDVFLVERTSFTTAEVKISATSFLRCFPMSISLLVHAVKNTKGQASAQCRLHPEPVMTMNMTLLHSVLVCLTPFLSST